MWLLVGIVVVAVVTGVVLVVNRARKPSGTKGPSNDMTAEQWSALGVIFTGTGVALAISTGPAMIGMVALGLIYLVKGASMKRTNDPS